MIDTMSGPTISPFILCENLVKVYRVDELEVVALQRLDLEVQQGEFLAIVGASGSGKSSLLNMLGGLDRPSAGRLLVDGQDLLKLGDQALARYRLNQVGFVWQQSSRNLLPYLTAQENVEMPMGAAGAPTSTTIRYAQELLEAVGLAADYGVDFVEDYADILARADVDAVLIATPHINHIDQVLQAAQAGKQILCEKPLATSVVDCTRMIDGCHQAGVMLQVIQTLRFRGTPARAKQLIAAGTIGKVWMIRGQTLVRNYVIDKSSWAARPENGGAFLDMGVHNFDIMRFWTDSEVRRVFSQINTFGTIDAPGMRAMTQLTMTSGVSVQQWMSFEVPTRYMTDSQHIYHILGEEGMIEVNGYGKLLLAKGDTVETVWEPPKFDFVNWPLDPIRLEAFYTQIQTFVDDLLDGRPATVPGEEGRAAVAIVEAARESARTGQTVEMSQL